MLLLPARWYPATTPCYCGHPAGIPLLPHATADHQMVPPLLAHATADTQMVSATARCYTTLAIDPFTMQWKHARTVIMTRLHTAHLAVCLPGACTSGPHPPK